MHRCDELPWQSLLSAFGVTPLLRASEGSHDAGGQAAANASTGHAVTVERTWIGVRTQAGEGGVQLTFVQHEGPAERAGLSAGDVIMAIDGLRVSVASWEKRLQQYTVGTRISVYAFRRDESLLCTLELASAPLDTCFLSWAPAWPSVVTLAEASDTPPALLEHWLLARSLA